MVGVEGLSQQGVDRSVGPQLHIDGCIGQFGGCSNLVFIYRQLSKLCPNRKKFQVAGGKL